MYSRSMVWKGVILGVLIIFTFLVWVNVYKGSQKVLTVSFLDVGQGDAILIESPTGNQVLIDGGAGRQVLRSLGQEIPFYDRTLDLIIASHPDADHIGGLVFVLERYGVTGVVAGKDKAVTDVFYAFTEAVVKEEAIVVEATSGTRFLLGGGAVLDILWPDSSLDTTDRNDGSIVALLRFEETSFLLTGDISSKIEDYLVQRFSSEIDIDVLKLAHHGSNTSSSDYFLLATSPEWAVISAGKDNRYGHPHDEVVERLEGRSISYTETAKKGNITFVSDGQSIICQDC